MRLRVRKLLPKFLTSLPLMALFFVASSVSAQTSLPLQPAKILKVNMFKRDFAKSFFNVEDVSAADDSSAGKPTIKQVESKEIAAEKKVPAEQKSTATNSEQLPSGDPSRGPMFVGNFKAGDILPPDQNPRVRINPEAPAPFIAMASANQDGDKEMAQKYAEQWVRYQQNFFFEVRQITDLIGQALVKQKVIADDDWQGVPQYLDYEFAQSRAENGAIFRPTHDQAMARIKADEKGEAGIYFFFTMNCAFCRSMASDVERLFQATKSDTKIKMVGLTMGPTPNSFLSEYRRFSGATFPIYEGPLVAKEFNVQFVPALVVVAPNSRRAYLKSGQQSFERMLEFVRRVQGKPLESKETIKILASLKVGEVEKTELNFGGSKTQEFLRPEEREIVKKAKQNKIALRTRNERTSTKESEVKF